MNALWRKSFFCKPYTGDRADALRFKDEFEDGAEWDGLASPAALA